MIDLSQLEKIKTVEDIARESAAIGAVAYLKETDWYVVRLMETGKAIPDEVRLLRAQARETAGRISV